MRWSVWTELDLRTPFSNESLRETLDGGQAFRWNYSGKTETWRGVWERNIVELRLAGGESLQCRWPRNEEDSGDVEAIQSYLQAETDWLALANSLPCRSDAVLGQAMDAFPGLRILNQPFPETLLCFLCSATKRIPQIKALADKLAHFLGEEIDSSGVNALPTWEQLARADEAALRALGLGFRARNIKGTAEAIARDPNMLERIEALPYGDARAELQKLPGVGSKVADCALLFGAGKYGAFPVDTWILKVLETRYGLSGWKKAQLEQFGRIHFGPYAGFAQQFLFARERAAARTSMRI